MTKDSSLKIEIFTEIVIEILKLLNSAWIYINSAFKGIISEDK